MAATKSGKSPVSILAAAGLVARIFQAEPEAPATQVPTEVDLVLVHVVAEVAEQIVGEAAAVIERRSHEAGADRADLQLRRVEVEQRAAEIEVTRRTAAKCPWRCCFPKGPGKR